MKNLVHPLIALVVLIIQFTSATAEEPRRMALVIGNGEYTHKGKLPNAVNDAESIANALKQVGFTVTKKLNRISKNQMRQDVDEFVESLHKNDACFVFYAGHGLSFNNANYLVPVDAELRLAHHVAANCLEVKYLKDALKWSRAGLKVVILDACRSEEVLPVRVRGGVKGMVREPVFNGMVMAFSTAPGEVALDGAGRNSPYTKHLVRTIQAKYERGLTLNECFRLTARAVFHETQQRPYRESDDTLDDFYLKPAGGQPSEMADKSSFSNPGFRVAAVERESAEAIKTQNNGKLLALAFHNFADAYAKFPAAYTADYAGKPLLSWRVHLLPYLGESTLYDQFKLDQPWDSEHNKQLIDKMPDVFKHSALQLPKGKTVYLAVTGDDAVFTTPQAPGGKKRTGKHGFRDVLDGTSNTAMMVEVNAANAVTWTQPGDISTDGASVLEKTKGIRAGDQFLLVIGDGSVQIISPMDAKSLGNILKINDGNIVEIP